MATWAEDEIGRKWDRCFTDAIFKFGNYYLIIETVRDFEMIKDRVYLL